MASVRAKTGIKRALNSTLPPQMMAGFQRSEIVAGHPILWDLFACRRI